jgi:NifU-like protein involved in Fe-S cluster formation
MDNEQIDKILYESEYSSFRRYGKIENPSAVGTVRGICGDEISFYLNIESDIIVSVKYLTNGCSFTKLCAEAVAREAEGKKILDSLGINPKHVLFSLRLLIVLF